MIQLVLSTLFHVIVPISIPIIVGALLSRFRKLDTKPLLTLHLYFLSPAILLDTLLTAEITMSDVYQIGAFSLLNLLLLWALAGLTGRLLGLSSPDRAGLTLIATFTNSVNYGLPLVLLTLGQMGLDKASVYVVGQMIIVNTIGVYFAARSEFSIRSAVKSVFKLPSIYAAVLAIALRGLELQLPEGVISGIALSAAAYSPIALVVLGAQMMTVAVSTEEKGAPSAFWSGMTIRLLLSPFIAILCLKLLHIEGIVFDVLLILATMPVAVNAVVLSQKFNASPRLVSRCILWTTLASFIVLPLLIVIIDSV